MLLKYIALKKRVLFHFLFFSQGITCTKSIVLTIHDTVLLLKRGEDPVRAAAKGFFKPTERIEIIKSTFNDIIMTRHGVKLIWDRGTKITVHLDKRYRGKVIGTIFKLFYKYLFRGMLLSQK